MQKQNFNIERKLLLSQKIKLNNNQIFCERIIINKYMKNKVYEYVKNANSKNHCTIGLGSYGEVKLARDVETSTIVAIKIMMKTNAQKQCATHYKLNHPNIIRLLNDYYDEKKHTTYMVMEYADGGTLYDKIRNSSLDKKQVCSYFYQICQAIKYMHQNELIHRDIKPENILLTKTGQVKLCDFGMVGLIGDQMTSSVCGTYQYMSPEMIKKLPYDQKIDIWALGILLFQMIEGTAPFRGETPDEVMNQMKKNLIFSEKFEPQQINLVKTILRVNSYNRPTITQILQHDYFSQLNKQQTKEANISMRSTKTSEEEQLRNRTEPTVTKKQQILYRPVVKEFNSKRQNLHAKNKLAYCKSFQDLRSPNRF